MNAVPPPSKQRGVRPLVTTTCTLTWPHGGEVTAVIKTRDFDELAPIEWSGDMHRILAPRLEGTAGLLIMFLEDEAKRTGGTFAQRQEGLWAAMDEVKG